MEWISRRSVDVREVHDPRKGSERTVRDNLLVLSSTFVLSLGTDAIYGQRTSSHSGIEEFPDRPKVGCE